MESKVSADDIGKILNEIDDDEAKKELSQTKKKFRWYRHAHGDNVKFLENNQIELCGANKKRKTNSEIACIGYKIHLREIKQLVYEVNIDKLNRQLGIGFVIPNPSDNLPAVTDWHKHLLDGDGFGFNVKQGDKVIGAAKSDKFENVKVIKKEMELLKSCKKGDCFRIYIHGPSKTIEVFYNDKSVGIVFTNIPNFLIPAVSCAGKKEICTIALKACRKRKFRTQSPQSSYSLNAVPPSEVQCFRFSLCVYDMYYVPRFCTFLYNM